MRRLTTFVALAAIIAAAVAWFAWREPDYGRVPVGSLQDLEQQLESLRTDRRIPGMSAAIAEDDRVMGPRNGNGFSALTQIVERATGEPFARQIANRIIRPPALTRTAPNPGDPRPFRSLAAHDLRHPCELRWTEPRAKAGRPPGRDGVAGGNAVHELGSCAGQTVAPTFGASACICDVCVNLRRKRARGAATERGYTSCPATRARPTRRSAASPAVTRQ